MPRACREDKHGNFFSILQNFNQLALMPHKNYSSSFRSKLRLKEIYMYMYMYCSFPDNLFLIGKELILDQQ